MSKPILYAYPLFAMATCIFTVVSGEATALCSGCLFALAFLSLPLWLLAVTVHVNESAADDDIYDDYSIEISYRRGGKKRGDN